MHKVYSLLYLWPLKVKWSNMKITHLLYAYLALNLVFVRDFGLGSTYYRREKQDFPKER